MGASLTGGGGDAGTVALDGGGNGFGGGVGGVGGAGKEEALGADGMAGTQRARMDPRDAPNYRGLVFNSLLCHKRLFF